ncbi:MAG: hypothetical protein ACI3ZY_02445 [Parabacteroides sp.]
MQEEEYTFVTLEGNDAMPADAVLVDVDNLDVDLSEAVIVEDMDFVEIEHQDFITLADDTVMLSDVDTLDMTATDMYDADITFIV